VTAVAASGFTFVSWWQSCCVRGRAIFYSDHAFVPFYCGYKLLRI